MKGILICVVFITVISGTIGDDCKTFVGDWYNQHGSEMVLRHSTDGTLTGDYITKVETTNGSAGTKKSDVIGVAEYDTESATFGFSVMWRDGKSTTVWTGQCHICGGEAVLMTSWLLRSKMDTCGDVWKAVRIGQDYFKRKTPPTRYTLRQMGLSPSSTSDGLLHAMEHAAHTKEDTDTYVADECKIPGVWYNNIGSKLEANEVGKGMLKGNYWTGKEVQTGKLSGKHSHVHGQYNPALHQHTMAFFVGWNKGESVTGWVGQCHVCPTPDNKTEEVLETTWFHRVSVQSCHANWKSTLYGQSTFKHSVQRPIQPGDDVIGEFGEDVGLCPPFSAAPGATYRHLYDLVAWTVLSLLLVKFIV